MPDNYKYIDNDKNKKDKKDKTVFEYMESILNNNVESDNDKTFNQIIAERLINSTKEKNNKEDITKEKKKTKKYNISKEEAFNIASESRNLKTDFVKNSNRKNVTFLTFGDKEIKLVNIKNKKYWQIQILDGEISQMYNDSFFDGFIKKEENKYLRCLVDANTGEYIYYPKK